MTLAGFDQTLPTLVGPVRLQVNDVILARTGLPAEKFSLTNQQYANYGARLSFPGRESIIMEERLADDDLPGGIERTQAKRAGAVLGVFTVG